MQKNEHCRHDWAAWEPKSEGSEKMTRRNQIERLLDIPNIGPAMEVELVTLGITRPDDLVGKDPYQMYRELCNITQKSIDPCVIDVFISAVRYMEGGPPRKWWEFTQERKAHWSK